MDADFDFHYFCASSHLRLSEKEKNRLSSQLKRIVDWIAELERALPLKKESVFHQSLCRLGTLRKDEIGSSFAIHQALSNSPESKDGYFHVPKVIKSK